MSPDTPHARLGVTILSSALFVLAFPMVVHLVTGGELFGAFMIIPLTLIAWNQGLRAGLIAAVSGVCFTETVFNTEYFLIRRLDITPYWGFVAFAPALVFLFNVVAIGRFGKVQRELQETIATRSQLENTLSAAHQAARRYLDIAGVLLMALDQDGRITLMNRKGHAILGYEEGELIGKDFTTCLPVRMREEMRAAYKRLLQGEPALEYFENPVLTKNGEERLIAWHNTLLRDESGKLLVSLSSGEDITERRKAEEALTKSHAHMNAVMNALPDPMYELDREGVVYDVRVSRTDRLLHPRRMSPVGRKIADALPADAAGKIMDAVNQAGQSGGYQSPALEFRGQGQEQWFELSIAAVGDHRAGDCHFIVLAHDVTERTRLEQQLIQSQKMEAIGRLSGGIAHDFNNILMVIMGFCDVIRTVPADHEETMEHVKVIRDSAERAASLTQQLLAFSRKQVLTPRVVDVDGLIRDSRPMLVKMLGEDITFSHEPAGESNVVRADTSQLQQVIMNLAVNARDAMPGGGSFVIKVQGVELDRADSFRPAEMAPGEYVAIHVSDTGAGMDGETRSHVFEPFFTTKELGKGTGLGLSIVYGIVKQSEGYIYVDSKLGGGTTFSIYLPRVHKTDEAPSSRPVEEHRGTETILVVEDEQEVRELIARHLTGCGYQVLEAANGADALDLCSENRNGIRLLITDIGLPGLRGWKVAEEFEKSNPLGRILYMTGYTDSARFGELSSRVKADLLQKPFSMSELATRVRGTLDAEPHAPDAETAGS